MRLARYVYLVVDPDGVVSRQPRPVGKCVFEIDVVGEICVFHDEVVPNQVVQRR